MINKFSLRSWEQPSNRQKALTLDVWGCKIYVIDFFDWHRPCNYASRHVKATYNSSLDVSKNDYITGNNEIANLLKDHDDRPLGHWAHRHQVLQIHRPWHFLWEYHHISPINGYHWKIFMVFLMMLTMANSDYHGFTGSCPELLSCCLSTALWQLTSVQGGHLETNCPPLLTVE